MYLLYQNTKENIKDNISKNKAIILKNIKIKF